MAAMTYAFMTVSNTWLSNAKWWLCFSRNISLMPSGSERSTHARTDRLKWRAARRLAASSFPKFAFFDFVPFLEFFTFSVPVIFLLEPPSRLITEVPPSSLLFVFESEESDCAVSDGLTWTLVNSPMDTSFTLSFVIASEAEVGTDSTSLCLLLPWPFFLLVLFWFFFFLFDFELLLTSDIVSSLPGCSSICTSSWRCSLSSWASSEVNTFPPSPRENPSGNVTSCNFPLGVVFPLPAESPSLTSSSRETFFSSSSSMSSSISNRAASCSEI
mmetsp:Transcript_5370/g.9190  ORF Transcript_5370/g.9190 Transcript_5370/m.9190 type:complete len:272 (+) Transcript_5370:2735-3550(+)